MLHSLKHIMFYTLFFICINHLNAQYTTSDFGPANLISEGLSAPGRMAVDNNDNIYVTDVIQKIVVKYDSQGNYQTTISTDFSPTSIAINDNDLLFIADKGTGNIYIVSENGDKTLFYSGINRPNSMVFGLKILYLTYSKEKKVIGIDISGNIVTDFTYEKFVYPTGIAFDPANNYLLVAEHGGIGEDMEKSGGCSMCWSSYGPQTAVYAFDLEGNHIRTFGFFGNEDGEFQRIQGVTVGTCGNYYAVDPYLGRVSVFDNNGNYITKFGLHGNGAGELNLPMDIVFTSDNRAFVSSMNKGAIDVFSINQSLPTATITSADQTVCSLENAIVEVQLTGTAPWTFTYTIDGINHIDVVDTYDNPYSISPLTAGLYEVSELNDATTTPGTCLTGTTYIIESIPPTAEILTTELSKCTTDDTGIEIQFTGIAPWTFTYTIDGLNPIEINTTNNPYTLSTEQSGIYEIITLFDDGCTGEVLVNNASVTINPLPIIELPDNLMFCEGNSIELNPGNFESYSWSDGSTSQILTVDTTGIYTVTVIDQNGCSVSASISVSLNSIPDVDLGPEINICEGDPLYILDAGEHNSYLWSDGSTSRTLEVGTAGIYNVAVTNASGCTASDSVNVNVLSFPDAYFYYNANILEVQFENDSYNTDSHHWDFGDGNTSTAENPVHTYNFSGIYQVVYTAIGSSCGSSQHTETVEVVDDSLALIDKNFKKNKVLDIYPNPSTGDFMLKLKAEGVILNNIHVYINNSTGQNIFIQVYNSGAFDYYQGNYYIPISLNNFNDGTYLIYVQSGNFEEQAKLILKY